MRRRWVVLTLISVALPSLGVASAATGQTSRPLYIVVTHEPSEARATTLTYERRLGLNVETRYVKAVGGFATRLTPDQLHALQREVGDSRDFSAVARNKIEVAVFLRGTAPANIQIDSVAGRLGVTPTARSSRLLRGFAATLSAAQLAMLDRLPDAASVGTAGSSYIASVGPGVDGVAKAKALRDRLGLKLRHTYPEWFSFTTPSPSQLSELEADEEVVRLELNQTLSGTDPAERPPPTLEMGKAVGDWRLGMKYRAAEGLQSTRARPASAAEGCFGHPQTARWIDYYRQTRLGSPVSQLRLSWQHDQLTNIATTQRGVRTETGFAIGTATLTQVRARFSSAKFFEQLSRDSPYWRSPYRLGRSLLTVTKPTGIEAWVSTYYWFDRQGLLVALETLKGGC